MIATARMIAFSRAVQSGVEIRVTDFDRALRDCLTAPKR
jgi:predicted transcriptional regulator of viral defense system